MAVFFSKLSRIFLAPFILKKIKKICSKMLKIESKKVEKTVTYFAVSNSEESELEMKVAIDQWTNPPKTEAGAFFLSDSRNIIATRFASLLSNWNFLTTTTHVNSQLWFLHLSRYFKGLLRGYRLILFLIFILNFGR